MTTGIQAPDTTAQAELAWDRYCEAQEVERAANTRYQIAREAREAAQRKYEAARRAVENDHR